MPNSRSDEPEPELFVRKADGSEEGVPFRAFMRVVSATVKEAESLGDQAEATPWEAWDYDARLLYTVKLFAALRLTLKEPTSFRSLIYGRLGFGPDAYAPLYCAGAMDVNNALVMERQEGGAEPTLHETDEAVLDAAEGATLLTGDEALPAPKEEDNAERPE